MATIAVAAQDQFIDLNLYLWGPFTTTNLDGAPITYHGTGDRTITVDGVFGAGGTITVQGSNDPIGGGVPTNWWPLTFVGGAAATFTTGGIKLISECPAWIRPLLSGGDGTTALNVRLAIRRNKTNG
jgi:hypothetical protein